MKGSRAVWGSACVVVLILTTGCAWQRVPPVAPDIAVESIPLSVGVVLEGDSGSVLNGERVVKYLGDWGVFQSLEHPHKPDSNVDAVLSITIDSTYSTPDKKNHRRAFFVGLSLGALSPFIGQSVLHVHHMEATLKTGGREVGRYAIDSGGEVDFGLGADEITVLRKTLKSDMSWLAYDLAEKIRADLSGTSETTGP